MFWPSHGGLKPQGSKVAQQGGLKSLLLLNINHMCPPWGSRMKGVMDKGCQRRPVMQTRGLFTCPSLKGHLHGPTSTLQPHSPLLTLILTLQKVRTEAIWEECSSLCAFSSTLSNPSPYSQGPPALHFPSNMIIITQCHAHRSKDTDKVLLLFQFTHKETEAQGGEELASGCGTLRGWVQRSGSRQLLLRASCVASGASSLLPRQISSLNSSSYCLLFRILHSAG